MNIALIFALETKCWGIMFVAFLFRVRLCRDEFRCVLHFLLYVGY